MKIITVMGCRPHLIKLDKELPQEILWTGQHHDYRMSSLFFKELDIPKPTWNLNCKGNQVGMMVDKLVSLFHKFKPPLVQVFGDTNSSMAGALAAAYCNIPVAHVESGLRSFDMSMPEEVNRVIIDRISKVKFCPNSYSATNLLNEGIKDHVYIVGDPSLDTLGSFLPIPKGRNYREYILLTIHRNFTVDEEQTLKRIFEVLGGIGEKIIFPIHPRTKKNIKKFGIKLPDNIKPVLPQSYKQSLTLISNAKKVITDSGGVQREAFWMNVPVIILRKETEWIDIIGKKGGVLVGYDPEKILEAVKNFRGYVNSPPEFGAKKKIKETLFKFI